MVDVQELSSTNLNLFESLCNKIACLVYSRTDGDKRVLSKILDDLNALDYNLFYVKKERGVLLVNQCCYLIPTAETSLSSKALDLFINLITKGQVTVEGKTLSLAICWCLECLKTENQINTLKYLQALVKKKGKKIEEHFYQIISDIIRLSENFSIKPGSEEICLNCLRCVESITFPAEPENDGLSEEGTLKCFEIFKTVLFREKSSLVGDEIVFCKFLITAMRGIGNLIQTSNHLVNVELGNILGIIKGYMLYALPGQADYKIQKVMPSSTTIPEVLKSSTQPLRKLGGKYDRRSKKVAVTSISAVEEVDDTSFGNDYFAYSEKNQEQFVRSYKTSDSDFSDSEFTQNTKVKTYEGKVRHCALILMATLIQKTDPKVFIAYLPSFLPDNSQFLHMRTLVTCLLKDPLPKCRFEVLGVLSMIISNSRQYFLQADGISKSSFIVFSYTISNIIKELHKCLFLALQSEKNNTVIKRTLKCISVLIRCSPYHKMEPGLITNIAKNVKGFLKHKDVNVQIFALTVFGCLISIEPKVQEVKEIIIGKDNADALINGDCEDILPDDLEFCEEDDLEILTEKPWLFEQCLENLTDKNRPCDSTTNAALQVESLQVVGALARNFFRETVASFPKDIIHLLEYCSNKSEYSIRLYSGKLMETVFSSLQYSFRHEDESKRASFPLVTLLWESLLPGPVTKLIQSPEIMLRRSGCECIANVGIEIQNVQMTSVQNSLIFDQLPRDKQIMCITLVFGCIRDESPSVRSSAVRALAIFVLFSSLREDALFILDAVDIAIQTAKDEHNIVRTQASWLLGNLSEAIVLNKQNGVDDGITLDVVARLLKTGIVMAADSPKIKPGAVRGIGNLLQIINEEFMKKYKDTIVEALDALIKTATSGTFMKARWNACYAIAYLLQNPLIHSNGEWMAKIFNVMIALVQHYKNFKVRISAGLVLSVPPTRKSYGDLYNDVWSAILNALENSKNISDFNEYQHRDQLVDQLCLVMCHLVSLIEPGDLMILQDVLYFQLDNLTHFMAKFHERIVPEKSNVVLKAIGRIHSLLDERGLSIEEKGVLRTLDSLLANDK